MEKAPEAEPLLLEGAVQGRRHQMQPLIPPAADLYLPVQQQEPHHDHVRALPCRIPPWAVTDKGCSRAGTCRLAERKGHLVSVPKASMHVLLQVTESSIEMAEKQASTGSLLPSSEGAAAELHHAEGSAAGYHEAPEVGTAQPCPLQPDKVSLPPKWPGAASLGLENIALHGEATQLAAGVEYEGV